jgi:hypothetical protein
MRTNTGQQEPDTEQSKYAALIAQASILAAMLFTLLFTAFGSVQAQDNKKIPRVGFLSATSPTVSRHFGRDYAISVMRREKILLLSGAARMENLIGSPALRPNWLVSGWT